MAGPGPKGKHKDAQAQNGDADVGQIAGKAADPKEMDPNKPRNGNDSSPKRNAQSHDLGGSDLGSRVDPTLELSSSSIQFGATPVGTSATAHVSVRNTDNAPHTLDPSQPLIADPFREITVRENASVVLPGNESHTITVEYRPSRHASAEQTFQVSTDKGEGPQAQLTVRGTGTEAGGASEAERKQLEKERIADQDFQREHVEGDRTNDPNRAKRVGAEHAIAEWRQRAVEYNKSLADWTKANFDRFFGKTGGDVHVSEPGMVAKFIKSKALAGAKAMIMPEKAEEEEIAKTAVGKYGLKAVDKAVDKFTEWLWDQLSGEKKAPSAEEAALQATEHVAEKTIEKGRDISGARDAADLVVFDTESAALTKIAESNDAGALDGWRSWGQAQLHSLPKDLDTKDMSLSEELLASWVRERAATPKKANDETNSTAWDKARTELAKSGKVPTLATNDLFIHQCRNEWSRIGARTSDIEEALAKLDEKRSEAEQEAARGGITDHAEIAALIKDRVGSASMPIAAMFQQAGNPEAMRAAFAKNEYQLDPGAPQSRHFEGKFTMTCALMLKTSGASVYVEHFHYHDTDLHDFFREP